MTYEQYWNADPYLARYYAKAHDLEIEERNQQLWLQGLYNYKAFSAVIEAFGYGLGERKGKKPDGYIEKPIDILQKEKKKEQQEPTEYERAKAAQSVIDKLDSWKKNWDKTHKVVQ